MTSKTIDNIVWFIPYRKLRDNIRDFMNFVYNKLLNKSIRAWDGAVHFRKAIKNDADFYQKYLNLIKNLDNESVEVVNGILSKITNYNNIEDAIYFSDKESKRLNDLYEEFKNKIIKIN